MQELLVVSNPARRRRRGRKSTARRRRRRRAAPQQIAPVRRRGRRRARGRKRGRASAMTFRAATRDPVRFLMPAVWGAIGAITVNTAMSRVVPMFLPAPLQATFMVGRARYLSQALAAIALGMGAQYFGVQRQLAEQMAEGSLTVTMTDALRDLTLTMGLPLGGVGYYLPGRGVHQAVPSAGGRPTPQLSGMGKYITGPGSRASVIPLRNNGMGAMGFGPGRTF